MILVSVTPELRTRILTWKLDRGQKFSEGPANLLSLKR